MADQLPTLMDERGLSTNRLAALVGVNQSHLWRVIRRANKKTTSGELAARIAFALDLPPDWFPETRQALLFERVRADIALCDRLYDEFIASPSRAH